MIRSNMGPESYPTGHSESEPLPQDAQTNADENRGVAKNAEPESIGFTTEHTESTERERSANCEAALLAPLPVERGEEIVKVNGARLLRELRDVMSRYVVLPPMAAEALALWVVHTYAFTLRNVTTYIGIGSPEKRCGKTTLLRLLEKLASRSLMAANISPSALFRVIEETQPTLLIDEADTFLRGRDEMQGILNAGYDRDGAYVMRVAGKTEPFTTDDSRFADEYNVQGRRGAKTRLVRYSVWCPKVMAGIGQLPETLADRCIVITMQRKTSVDQCERLRTLKPAEFRARCAQFVREHAEQIRNAEPEIPEELNDRAADIWEPLLVIADLAGGEWPELARKAALKLSAEEDEVTLLGYFLKDLRNLFVIQERERMFSREIVEWLDRMHSRPWEDLRRGREINEWWLGAQLRQAGVHSRTMRIGEKLGKGYEFADVDAAFRRYVPNAEMHAARSEAGSSQAVPSSNQAIADSPETRTVDKMIEAHLSGFLRQVMITEREVKDSAEGKPE
jgi:putative DNA primase/helicase